MSESHCVSVRAPALQGLLIVAKEKWRAPRACVVPLREDLSACACVSLGVGAGVTLRQQKSTRPHFAKCRRKACEQPPSVCVSFMPLPRYSSPPTPTP